MKRSIILAGAIVLLAGCGELPATQAPSTTDGVRAAQAPQVVPAAPVVAAPHVGAAPAALPAGQGTPEALTLVLSPDRVDPGGSFTARLDGCVVGEVVTFTIQGAPAATTVCADTSPTTTSTTTTTTTVVPPTTATTTTTTTTTIPLTTPRTTPPTSSTTSTIVGVTVLATPPSSFSDFRQAPEKVLLAPGVGSATANLTAPTPAGVYSVVAIAATSGLTVSAPLTVVGAIATTTVTVTPVRTTAAVIPKTK